MIFIFFFNYLSSGLVSWLFYYFNNLSVFGKFLTCESHLSKGEAEESFPAGAWHVTSSTHHCGASGAQVIRGISS